MRGVRSRHCTPPSLGDLPMKKPAPAATHWCRTGNGFIFLDLASDRYFTLESGAADRFSLIVHRGQDAADDNWLAERGLHNLARPVDRIFPEAIAPTSSYLDSPGTERASAVDTIRAIYALALARRHVRKLRLAQILSTIPQFEPLPAEDQRSAARCAAAAFQRARHYFSGMDECLGRGIAIRRVLAGKGCDARLVIGVTLPFAAHCWVQLGSAVLTDPLDVVLPYTPILIA